MKYIHLNVNTAKFKKIRTLTQVAFLYILTSQLKTKYRICDQQQNSLRRAYTYPTYVCVFYGHQSVYLEQIMRWWGSNFRQWIVPKRDSMYPTDTFSSLSTPNMHARDKTNEEEKMSTFMANSVGSEVVPINLVTMYSYYFKN